MARKAAEQDAAWARVCEQLLALAGSELRIPDAVLQEFDAACTVRVVMPFKLGGLRA